jgi:hypothetical protein
MTNRPRVRHLPVVLKSAAGIVNVAEMDDVTIALSRLRVHKLFLDLVRHLDCARYAAGPVTHQNQASFFPQRHRVGNRWKVRSPVQRCNAPRHREG